MANTSTTNKAPAVSTTQLDHIVLLLSPSEFQSLPSWLSNNFAIFEGGTHTQGTSQNKLIIFKDGTYLELFSWIDPQPDGVEPYADFPGWANQPENHVIDWALTGDGAQSKYEDVVECLRRIDADGGEAGVTYDEPKSGGRRRKDGEELRWVTTRPRSTRDHEGDGSRRPKVPFFCHDVSPRVLRVPYTEGAVAGRSGIVNHPCGAVGIAGITIEVPQDDINVLAKLYGALLGTEAVTSAEGDGATYDFKLATPEQARKLDVTDQQGSGSLAEPCVVRLQAVETETPVPAGGLQKLVLRKEDKTEGQQQERLSPEGFGTPIYLC
ncbi:hypothetical protein LTR64_004328 [Lithohypha guttulata]|uniref:uncharacterized protein n=1 Tax=Lithohypha guttulata TaxID=1690604 RepID=UPI002DE02ED2|nr:hypothetical protein LTR51_006377 [Lithohypha guttulata]